MSKFIESPMDYPEPKSNKPPGTYNGCPGYPKRSGSGLPEKTYENITVNESTGKGIVKDVYEK